MANTTSKATSTDSLLNTVSISAATTTVADCNINNIITTDDSNVNEPAKSYNAEEYYKVQLERKEKEIVHLKKQLENSKKLVNFYKMKASSSGAASNPAATSISVATSTSRAAIDAQVINQSMKLDQAVKDVITDTIKSDRRFSRYGRARLGRQVANAIFDGNFLNGCALPYIIGNAKLWLRKNVFTPWNILKNMDLAGGSLNYKGLVVLRKVETEGKKYYRGGVLPCTADLKRAAKRLETIGDESIPFKEFQSEWGKGIKFCHARTVRLACDAYGVTEKAKNESVAISESIDAAQITKNVHFITAGFKMGDIDAIDPLTKKPLCIEGLCTNVQSRNNVFPTQIMVSKETKESYEAFKGFFDFFAMVGDKTIDRGGSQYYWEAIEGFQELDVTATMDMSAQWKGLRRGGACKQSHFFCHCCTVESKDVHHPNNHKCDRFCADRLDDDWKCYHHQIATNEVVENMKLKI